MYIEYYIIENLLINYIIISCTSILIKRHTNEKKKMDRCFFRNYILSKDNGLKSEMLPGKPVYIEGISYWVPDISKTRSEERRCRERVSSPV